MGLLWLLPFLFVGALARISCRPDTCATVSCTSAYPCDDGYVQKGGGFCGCCDNCIRYLDAGVNCFVTLMVGRPPRASCRPGHFCDQATMKCVYGNRG